MPTELILGLVIGLALLIFLILKTKIHAFLALIISAVVIGLIAGLADFNRTGDFSWFRQHARQHRYHHRLRRDDGTDFPNFGRGRENGAYLSEDFR